MIYRKRPIQPNHDMRDIPSFPLQSDPPLKRLRPVEYQKPKCIDDYMFGRTRTFKGLHQPVFLSKRFTIAMNLEHMPCNVDKEAVYTKALFVSWFNNYRRMHRGNIIDDPFLMRLFGYDFNAINVNVQRPFPSTFNFVRLLYRVRDEFTPIAIVTPDILDAICTERDRLLDESFAFQVDNVGDILKELDI